MQMNCGMVHLAADLHSHMSIHENLHYCQRVKGFL